MADDSTSIFNRLAQLQKLNSPDDKQWVGLISDVQGTNDLGQITQVFEAFLEVFPLCYGYWLKLANLTERLAPEDTKVPDVTRVFQRATESFPLCKEIWLRYIEFLDAKEATSEEVEAVYSRALKAVGSIPDADQLWLKYLEVVVKRSAEPDKVESPVVAVYKDILSRPLFKLEMFWSQFVGAVLPQQEVSIQAQLKQEVFVLYEKAKAKAARVSEYEQKLTQEGGGRPFFHFEPLSAGQKATWREYIGFVTNHHEDKEEVVLLYERCLVTCASYSEFWLSYIEWLERNELDFERINAIFDRATGIFFKGRPLMHLHHAEFLEQYGKEDRSREIYKHIVDILAPGWVRGILSFAHFERRNGDTKRAASIFETALTTASDLTRPFLSMQLAMLTKDVSILSTAVEAHPCCAASLNVWLCWAGLVDNVDDRTPVFEKALHSPYILGSDKEALWSHYEDHLLETSGDIRKVRGARRRSIVASGMKRKRADDPEQTST